MSIPPFPSQDLAKLVLGYLAEEQLMTAYDEFLQASPYLDACGNEYDRIFMTSLKNILAEYRAVKIYVETCKPFHLRRKLFQCTNLLDMVKFLINHVDISKLRHQENKCSTEKKSILETNSCEVCQSLKLETCSCNNKSSYASNSHTRDHYDESGLDSSVEATALSDLPGNHITRMKKSHRISDGLSDPNVISNTSSRLLAPYVTSENAQLCNNGLSKNAVSESLNNVPENEIPVVTEQVEQREELSSNLNQFCHNNQSTCQTAISSEVDNQRLVMGGYKQFATGVSGDSRSNIVPDSSTSEKVYVQIPVSVESTTTSNVDMANKPVQTRTQYLLKVAHINNKIKPNEIVTINTTNNSSLPKLKPVIDESKVRILSDIKVDNSFNSSEGSIKIPPILQNATSTPLYQMQTIVINGTRVYRQQPYEESSNYSKDEIMAMPTIILAPAPGPPPMNKINPKKKFPAETANKTSTESKISTAKEPQNVNKSSDINKSSTVPILGPLVIDVSSGQSTQISKPNPNNENQIVELSVNENVQKTLDNSSASAPKDKSVIGATESNTPQMLPPQRKSSSTPRRTSHVRVLDFTTPRRILQETMNKCATDGKNTEMVVSESAEVNYPISTEVIVNNDKVDTFIDQPKENVKTKKIKANKSNWDADLRALAVVSEVSSNPTFKPLAKPVKKKKEPKNSGKKKENEESKGKQRSKKRTTKEKSAKKAISEPDEVIDLSEDKVSVPVKPTINIISGVDRGSVMLDNNDKAQNKSNNDKIDTPDMERMSLQNEIGAKLNISDLLETPYKQALYDIQMETPRFLGPDIPDDPMSDIKIMNIPTPKFLNAPTPSSYSSRPTDYSSGGSYYKPDEQDYQRVSEDIIYSVTSSENKENAKTDIPDSNETHKNDSNEKNNDKPSRPVRKCTKNVSYYSNTSVNSKPKDAGDKVNITLSDTTDTSFSEVIEDKVTKNINIKENKTKSQVKLATTNRKSPIKNEASKSFMKIRSRRPTPVKKDVKKKKKTPESPKGQGRKKITKKHGGDTSTTLPISSVPTKSRRKSSTPRKLHCTKAFNSESSGHESPELVVKVKNNNTTRLVSTNDSDSEQLPLRWSDDGSQDFKLKQTESNTANESEDINKIKEYLKNVSNEDDMNKEGCLHIDLVKRGFDLETAKIIERELLDMSPHTLPDSAVNSDAVTMEANPEKVGEPKSNNENAVTDNTNESECTKSNDLQIAQDVEEEDVEEIELSVHECHEDTINYFSYNHDDIKDLPKTEMVKLKDKFSMEVCLDDDLSIRLRATSFSLLLDQEPDDVFLHYDAKETEMAIRSISNTEKLYTPLKESLKAQCYEIFDSTLTSLDTPLKAKSPYQREQVSFAEIVLEVEKVQEKEKGDTKKRKRTHSGNLSDESDKKRAKPQYLLNSANIQNIDIESVLSKLHGP